MIIKSDKAAQAAVNDITEGGKLTLSLIKEMGEEESAIPKILFCLQDVFNCLENGLIDETKNLVEELSKYVSDIQYYIFKLKLDNKLLKDDIACLRQYDRRHDALPGSAEAGCRDCCKQGGFQVE